MTVREALDLTCDRWILVDVQTGKELCTSSYRKTVIDSYLDYEVYERPFGCCFLTEGLYSLAAQAYLIIWVKHQKAKDEGDS